jgi:S-layer protein (TIGR01567 family)
MPRYLRLLILIFALIAPCACKEVAYVFGDDGGHTLDNITISDLNDSDAIRYTVSSDGGTSGSYEANTTMALVKSQIKQKINKGNRNVSDEGRILVGHLSGARRIDQICSIYDKLVDDKNWHYVSDWVGLENLQYSNQSLWLGSKNNLLGVGDCDDFSILLAALLESVQATSRIIFAYGPAGGHAYAQVYLGPEGVQTDRMIEWMKSKYEIPEIYTTKNITENGETELWLNLDWWQDPKSRAVTKKHPGGPFFLANNHTPVYYSIERASWTALTPVPVPPVAKFSVSNPNPNAKEDVIFNASESKDLDTQIRSYEWDFDDGTPVEKGKIISHNFSKGRVYNVTLKVKDSDNDGEKSNETVKKIAVNGLPIPVIRYNPKEPKVGDTVEFDGSKSFDPEKSRLTYNWEFGDGATWPNRKNSSHPYTTNGSYTVNLTVIDDKGAGNETSVKIKINLPPKAIMKISPMGPNTGDNVTFDASGSTDRDGSIMSSRWDFGDGTNASTDGKDGLVHHIYSNWGIIPVSLNVVDDNNASDENKTMIRVNARPIANFTYSPANPDVGDMIAFNSSSKDPDGTISYYWWDYEEDKQEGKKAYNTSYPYRTAGEFNVSLTVEDDMLARNSTTKTIIVRKVNQMPVLHSFAPDKKSPQEAGTSIVWIANASDPENDNLTFKFFLRGPSTNGELLNKTGWTSNSSWLWTPGEEDIGENQIEVRIRDGEHAGPQDYDSNKTASFTVSAPVSRQISRVADLGEEVFTWTRANFDGFYYDLDENLGSEKITFRLSGRNPSSATLSDQQDASGNRGIVYSTQAEPKAFRFKPWGRYEVIGFLGERYLAAYDSDFTKAMVDAGVSSAFLYERSKNRNLMVDGQLSSILMDDNKEMTITSAAPLKLEEGYELKIGNFDPDGNKLYLELSKDGQLIDSKAIMPTLGYERLIDSTYYYKADIGESKEIVQIAVHFTKAFRDASTSIAVVDGIFQISDTPTPIKIDEQYDKMSISAADPTAMTISMDNKDNQVTLSGKKDIVLMKGIHIKTANRDATEIPNPLRYWIYKDYTTPGTYDLRGMTADLGQNEFTYIPASFSGFYYDLDNGLGSEQITLRLSGVTSSMATLGDQPDSMVNRGITYNTTAQPKNFEFKPWGQYMVIGFLGERYLAAFDNKITQAMADAGEKTAYLYDCSGTKNLMADEQINRILMDDDREITVNEASPLTLEEGYALNIKSIDVAGNKVFLELTKDGQSVDNKVVYPSRSDAKMADKTYFYSGGQGETNEFVSIAVHFKDLIEVQGTNMPFVTIDGVFQISDTSTSLKPDQQYDKMSIKKVDTTAMSITMDNKDNQITLKKSKDVVLMQNINIRTADQDMIDDNTPLRYYIYKRVIVGKAD